MGAAFCRTYHPKWWNVITGLKYSSPIQMDSWKKKKRRVHPWHRTKAKTKSKWSHLGIEVAESKDHDLHRGWKSRDLGGGGRGRGGEKPWMLPSLLRRKRVPIIQQEFAGTPGKHIFAMGPSIRRGHKKTHLWGRSRELLDEIMSVMHLAQCLVQSTVPRNASLQREQHTETGTQTLAYSPSHLQGCEPQTLTGPGTPLHHREAWLRALVSVLCMNACKVHSCPLFPVQSLQVREGQAPMVCFGHCCFVCFHCSIADTQCYTDFRTTSWGDRSISHATFTTGQGPSVTTQHY